MKSLNQELINTISKNLKGNKLKKFIDSVNILNESLRQGSWVARGRVKADSGFYAGLITIPSCLEYNGFEIGTDLWKEMNEFSRCLNYGSSSTNFDSTKCLELLKNGSSQGKKFKLKIEDDAVLAWVELCREKKKAFQLLDQARPAPVLTEIKLSPRVTKTLKEMKLNIELSSVRFPELKRHEDIIEEKDTYGKLVKKKIVSYEVIWPIGTLHGKSRFSNIFVGDCNCEACGKFIPSRKLVPLYAKDLNSNQFVSFWLGRDCASNIFGVKDIGVNKDEKVS